MFKKVCFAKDKQLNNFLLLLLYIIRFKNIYCNVSMSTTIESREVTKESKAAEAKLTNKTTNLNGNVTISTSGSAMIRNLTPSKTNATTVTKKLAAHFNSKQIRLRPQLRLRLFQQPPQPLVFWPEPPPLPDSFQRPMRWEDKHFGQWCSNYTVNKHTQCPEATPFHWYVCCGEHNVECCGGPQTWTYFIFGFNIMQLMIVFMFYLLLHFNVIFKDEQKNCRNFQNCEKQHNNAELDAKINGTKNLSYKNLSRIQKPHASCNDEEDASDASLLRISTSSTPAARTNSASTTIATSCATSPASADSYFIQLPNFYSHQTPLTLSDEDNDIPKSPILYVSKFHA